MYLSSVFEWPRRFRRSRRVLVVLEEAHTIVPESSLFGRFDKETESVLGRISQIALQGRKYGVGLLLISQRTALVSKTLLSQCNTVLSFSVHDETGLKYLAKVFSTDHVTAIPNLKRFQAIGLGKGLKSERPVIFQILEDPEKQKASELLTKKWEEEAPRQAGAHKPSVEVKAEPAALEESDPKPLPLDDDEDFPF
jgi:DNA helicase HerA-like ATPase